MRKSKFTDEQIAFALKQAELGTSVDEVWREMGIAHCTVGTFCPARGPNAMGYVYAAACNALSTRAASESASLSAM